MHILTIISRVIRNPLAQDAIGMVALCATAYGILTLVYGLQP